VNYYENKRVLINHAGIVSGQPFPATSDGQIEQSLAVNFLAHIWTIRADFLVSHRSMDDFQGRQAHD
jgi:NAD(P)-dependent dehydrogenase (short-subunit alcohol dehydrogenase family)